jgi:hypothetical protein
VRPEIVENEEIFRLEYHVVDSDPRRSRIILTETDDLLRLNEVKQNGDWEVTNFDEINYFEYSDEDSDENDSHFE